MVNKKPLGVVWCYCHHLGHVRRDCRKLQIKNLRFQYAQGASRQSNIAFAYEYARLCQYQELLKFVSNPSTMLVGSGKPNACLISFSSIWIIDFGATDYMTVNSSLFTTFQSHPSTSTITLADGSTSCVLESRTIHATPQITLTFVLNLP